jgi:hypothetical protein
MENSEDAIQTRLQANIKPFTGFQKKKRLQNLT